MSLRSAHQYGERFNLVNPGLGFYGYSDLWRTTVSNASTSGLLSPRASCGSRGLCSCSRLSTIPTTLQHTPCSWLAPAKDTSCVLLVLDSSWGFLVLPTQTESEAGPVHQGFGGELCLVLLPFSSPWQPDSALVPGGGVERRGAGGPSVIEDICFISVQNHGSEQALSPLFSILRHSLGCKEGSREVSGALFLCTSSNGLLYNCTVSSLLPCPQSFFWGPTGEQQRRACEWVHIPLGLGLTITLSCHMQPLSARKNSLQH